MITEPMLDDWWQTLSYASKRALKEFVDNVEKGLRQINHSK